MNGKFQITSISENLPSIFRDMRSTKSEPHWYQIWRVFAPWTNPYEANTAMSPGRPVVSNHWSFCCLFGSLCIPTSKKHQSLHYWSFVRGIHRWPVNSPHKGPVSRKKASIWWRHHVKGKWPWHCTTWCRCLNKSIELWTERIHPGVSAIWILLSLDQPRAYMPNSLKWYDNTPPARRAEG